MLSDTHLVELNTILAGYLFVWFIVVLRLRIMDRDSRGGIWYAIGYDLVLFGITASSTYRLYKGIPVTTTPFTWAITAGLLCCVAGQLATLRNSKEKHGSDSQ